MNHTPKYGPTWKEIMWATLFTAAVLIAAMGCQRNEDVDYRITTPNHSVYQFITPEPGQVYVIQP